MALMTRTGAEADRYVSRRVASPRPSGSVTTPKTIRSGYWKSWTARPSRVNSGLSMAGMGRRPAAARCPSTRPRTDRTMSGGSVERITRVASSRMTGTTWARQARIVSVCQPPFPSCVPTAMITTSADAAASLRSPVKASRPRATPSATSRSSSGSWNGRVAARKAPSRPWSESTPTTSWSQAAIQAPVTSPTYPNPTTVTRMSSPSQPNAANYHQIDTHPPPRITWVPVRRALRLRP